MSETKETTDLLVDDRELIIKAAAIKDGFCNYSFEPLKGFSRGDVHSVKGASIIHEDLSEAMKSLNVHLAVIDDAFKASKYKNTDIDKLADDEITELYTVTGFKIKGSIENERVVLIGKKYVNIGGYIDLETPSINLDGGTYKWYNELNQEITDLRREVEEYMNGKCTPIQEEIEHPDQTKIQFLQPEVAEVADNTFEQGKV